MRPGFDDGRAGVKPGFGERPGFDHGRAWLDGYRDMPAYRQLVVVAPVLVAFAFSSHPILWTRESALLAVLFYLDLEPGLLLIAAGIPFSFAYKRIGAGAIAPTEVLIVACALAAGAQYIRVHARGTRAVRINRSDAAVLLLVALAFAALLPATDPGAAAWSLRLVIVEPAVVYLLVRSRRLDEEGLLWMALALVLGTAAVALAGLYQYFFTGYVEAVEGVRRILSIYDSPNHLALYVGRVLPLAGCLALWDHGHRRRLHALALLPLTLCLFLTYSRGAWLLGLPAALLATGLLRGRKATLRALGLLALALLALLPFAHTPRMTSLLDLAGGTSFNRLVLWQGTLRMLAAHPLTGVGLGNFQIQYPHYMLADAWREPSLYHPHNILLEFWANLGLPGLAALALLVAAYLRQGLRLYRRAGSDRSTERGEGTRYLPPVNALALGLLAGLAVFLAHGLVDSAYFLADLALLFMLSLGMLNRA